MGKDHGASTPHEGLQAPEEGWEGVKFPQRTAHQLVVHCQMVSPEDTRTSIHALTTFYGCISEYICRDTHTHICIQ